jgi:hypothetical protein
MGNSDKEIQTNIICMDTFYERHGQGIQAKIIYKQLWEIYFRIFNKMFNDHNKLYRELFDNSLDEIPIEFNLIEKIDKTFCTIINEIKGYEKDDFVKNVKEKEEKELKKARTDKKRMNIISKYLEASGNRRNKIYEEMQIIVAESKENADKLIKESKGTRVVLYSKDISRNIYFSCFFIYLPILMDAYINYKIKPAIANKQKTKKGEIIRTAEQVKIIKKERMTILSKANRIKIEDKEVKTNSCAIKFAKDVKKYPSDKSNPEYVELNNALNKCRDFLEYFDSNIIEIVKELFAVWI